MARPDTLQSRDLTQIEHGWDVYGSDGEKVGDVSDVTSSYLVVSKGFFFPKDRYIPATAIARIERDRVELNVTKVDLDNARWDAPPEDGTKQAMASRPTAEATTMDDDERTIQLREEELIAQKQTVEAGEVEIRKEVVSEQQSIDVPVTREEVVIERRPVDRAESEQMSVGDIREGETIRVPVREERVTVDKQAVVTEEIEIGKRAVQETQRVTDTVRREEARIEHDREVTVSGDHQHHFQGEHCTECGVARK